MLIIDGHRSYLSFEFIEYCKQNQIIALCFSPQITHIFQLLDVRIFGSIANAYKLLIEK